MAQDISMLPVLVALFSLFALNIITVGLMIRRNRRFLKIIRAMQGSAEVSMTHS